MKVNRVLWIVLFTLLIQACGIKFWYNRIDWAASWFIDDYVELSDAQEDRLEAFLELKTEWHRAEELPKYIEFIKAVKNDINDGTVANNYSQHTVTTREFFRSILEEMGGEIVSVMGTFSDEQVNGLLEVLAEQDKTRKEDFLESTPEELIEIREDNIREGVSDWIGRLTKAQKALIKEWASQVESTFLERMRYRERWRNAVFDVMSERETEMGQRKLLDLIQQPDTLQSDSIKASIKNNQNLGQIYVVKIYETLTKKQTRRLLNRLTDYQDDFQDLVDEGSDIES